MRSLGKTAQDDRSMICPKSLSCPALASGPRSPQRRLPRQVLFRTGSSAMTLPRFRVRSLMIVVAITALALAAEVTRRRMDRLSSEYRAKAEQWQQRAMIADLNAQLVRFHSTLRDERTPLTDLEDTGKAEHFERQAEFRIAMCKKYSSAANRPWLPVVKDLPEPKCAACQALPSASEGRPHFSRQR